ncbi:MAG: MiaB/RimO family radical SAM methylthiotransferase, partial [Clostridia bacterium]|nr:MiaB/RimO family radical SAM methylthiotransferase [Clostridia bacterium]
MKKISFCTLGCKVNQYETEAMTSLFKNRGYEIASFNDVCDIYIINTCTVTGEGERKSRQMIRRAHNLNPQAVILVTGCYSQVSPEKVKALEGVSIVMGTSERTRVVEIVEEYINQNKTPSVEDIMKKRNYEEMNISSYEDKTRAFVKIEDGCTEFCTYCIIPYARGPVRSRNPESITKEVTELAKNGYREIVLTGIHIGSYGKDLKDKTLLDAIKAVNEVPDIKRIRLGSVEPRILTKDFIEEISKMPKVC